MSRIALGLVGLLTVLALSWTASQEPSAVTGRAVPYWGTPPQVAAAAAFARCADKTQPGTSPFTVGPALVHHDTMTVVGRSPDLILACDENGSAITSAGAPVDRQTPPVHTATSYGMISDPDGTNALVYGATAPEVAAVNVLGPAKQVQHALVRNGTFLAPVPWITTGKSDLPTFQTLDAAGTVLYEGP
jgi:hypothetical protein